jgi:hypothetical protein
MISHGHVEILLAMLVMVQRTAAEAATYTVTDIDPTMSSAAAVAIDNLVRSVVAIGLEMDRVP